MSKGATFTDDVLKLFFWGTAIADIADNDQSSPVTTLTVALHTADPDESGDQTTSEIAYTGYARVAVARSSAGWAIASGTVTPVANMDFPVSTGGAGGTITHFSVGTGVGNKLMYSGPVTPNIAVSSGVTPRLTTATAIIET